MEFREEAGDGGRRRLTFSLTGDKRVFRPPAGASRRRRGPPQSAGEPDDGGRPLWYPANKRRFLHETLSSSVLARSREIPRGSRQSTAAAVNQSLLISRFSTF